MTHIDDEDLRALAHRRVNARIGFFINLVCYLGCLPLFFWPTLRDGTPVTWALGPVLGWGAGVAIHAVMTFGRPIDWRGRMVEAEMERLRRR